MKAKPKLLTRFDYISGLSSRNLFFLPRLIGFIVMLILGNDSLRAQQPVRETADYPAIRQILNDYYAGIGGKKNIAKVKNTSYSWKILRGADEIGRMLQQSKMPDAKRTDMTMFSPGGSSRTLSRGANSELAWLKKMDGKVENYQPGTMFNVSRLEAILGGSHLLNIEKMSVQSRVMRLDEVEGVKAYLVEFSFADKNSELGQIGRVHYWFRADDKRILQISDPETNEIARFGDYRPVGKIFEPFLMEMVRGGKVLMTLRLENAQQNLNLPDELFTNPNWSASQNKKQTKTPSVSTVLENCYRAVGGLKNLKLIKDATLDFKILMNGQNLGASSTRRKYPSSVRDEGASGVNVGNDREAWGMSPKGDAQLYKPQGAELAKLQAALEASYLREYEQKGIAARVLDTEKVNGSDAHPVEFSRNGARLIYYFDADSHYLVKVRDEQRKSSVFYSDYRADAGNKIKEPHRIELLRDGRESGVTLLLIDSKYNTGLDDNLFAFPATKQNPVETHSDGNQDLPTAEKVLGDWFRAASGEENIRKVKDATYEWTVTSGGNRMGRGRTVKKVSRNDA